MTIAEVSRQYDISADTLRYYERIGVSDSFLRSPGTRAASVTMTRSPAAGLS